MVCVTAAGNTASPSISARYMASVSSRFVQKAGLPSWPSRPHTAVVRVPRFRSDTTGEATCSARSRADLHWRRGPWDCSTRTPFVSKRSVRSFSCRRTVRGRWRDRRARSLGPAARSSASQVTCHTALPREDPRKRASDAEATSPRLCRVASFGRASARSGVRELRVAGALDTRAGLSPRLADTDRAIGGSRRAPRRRPDGRRRGER